VDASEEAKAAEFAASLNLNISQSSRTGGVLGEVSAELATGQLKVVAFLPEALESNVTVTAFSSTSQLEISRVEVSPQVLSQVAEKAEETGAILLSMTSLSPQTASKFQDQRLEGEARSVAGSEAVSVNLRAPDGRALSVQNLVTPLRIVIKTDKQNATCAFWDEQEKRWSFRGLETVPDPTPGQITCLTSHLSIFSAVAQVIWENTVIALVCSGWDLVSPEGLQRLAETHWQSSLPAASVFTFVALFLLVFVRAVIMDQRSQAIVPWEEIEPVLFRQAATPEGGEEEVPKGWCLRRVAEIKDWTFWCAGICFGIQDFASFILECKAPEASVNRCIRSLHAHRSGVATDSLRIILQPDEKFELEEEPERRQVVRAQGRRSRFSRLVQEVGRNMDDFRLALRDLGARWNVHIHGASTVRSILTSRWYIRVGLLFPAFHPWIALLRLSLLTSYKVRVSLIFLKLTTAGATNALFFTSSSPPLDSDPACRTPQSLGARLVQNTVVGMVSACLGDCVVFALFLVQDRKPIAKDWTEEAKKWQLAVWKMRAVVFWLVWLAYLAISLLYILVFLANRRLEDAHSWYMSTGMSLLQDLVVLPLFLALALGTTASLALLNSRIRRSIEAKWLEGHETQAFRGEPEEEAPPSRRTSEHSWHFHVGRGRAPGVEQAPEQQDFARILPGVPQDV